MSRILATVDGCLKLRELPDPTTWEAPGEHFQMVAFWSSVPGCEATIEVPIIAFDWLENFDGLGGLRTVLRRDLLPSCGRVQFDAGTYVLGSTDGTLDDNGLRALVVDLGPCLSVPSFEAPPIDVVPTPSILSYLFVAALVWRRWRT